ncbi:MAG: polysaccharide biosynthesis tyrosine autokinase [Chitinophagaceae bacterium]
MSSTNQKTTAKGGKPASGGLLFKYLPYWPIFIAFLLISLCGAWYYLRITPKKFEIEASVEIKDEKKGTSDGETVTSIQQINSKKIVENEIEIFRSRSLMAEVVKNLRLYAPVMEEGKFSPKSAYTTSPVVVEAADLDNVKAAKKVLFQFSEKDSQVVIDAKRYPLNQLVNTEYGSLKFTPNKRQFNKAEGPLFFSLEDPKKTTSSLLEGLTATATSKLTSILTLKIRDTDPRQGEDILNELISVYNLAALREKMKLANTTSSFLDNRLKEVKQELNEIEGKAQAFKSSQSAVDISTQGKLLLQSSTEAGQKLQEVDLQLSAINEVEKYVKDKESRGGIVPSMLGLKDPTLPKLLDQLQGQELEYEKLKQTTAENHPMLLAIKDQINKIKPGILENISNQRKTLEASKYNLNSSNNLYSSTLQSLPEKERALIDIQRQQLITSNMYEFLRQKKDQSDLSSLNIANTRVVDNAQASLEPVTPKSKLIYLVALILSIILPASIVSIKEFLNRKILFRSEIEALTNTPIIGEISMDKSKDPLVIQQGKRTFIAEQFRRMRTSLGYVGGNSGKKKILVTSSLSGEGKSFVAANLALSLALTDKKVVLLELDLANPSLSTKLNVNYEEGVSNYLWGECEPEYIIKRTATNNNLFFVPSGPLPENPSELLMSDKLKELLVYLEEAFDIIVIDSAPASLLSDAYVLSPMCDVTLYVVKHKFTPKSYLERLDEENGANQLNNMRIVFNGIQSRGFTKNGYGYGYGYGYIHNNETKTKTRKKKYTK